MKKTNKILFMFTICFMFLLSVPTAAAAGEQNGALAVGDSQQEEADGIRQVLDPVVTVYKDGDYRGASQQFGIGEYDVEVLQQAVGNDQISSVRVRPGYQVVLYDNYRFGGASKVLTQDCSNLKSIGFNDKVSSLKVELMPAEPVVTVYKDADYQGVSQQLGAGSFDVGVLEMGVGNDQISSIRVSQGYQVTLYKDYQFSGASLTLTQDRALIGGDFHDSISSIRIEPVNPVDATCVDITGLNDSGKAEVMKTFAPRIWLAAGESYMPSTVEYALQNTVRTWMPEDNAYWYLTKEPLPDSDTQLDYFAGDLANAKIYSFWVEKEYNNVDLSYFQFTPYDSGKMVVGQRFGCHVGDWEHVTVRLTRFAYEGREYLKPIQVALPAHYFVNTYDWSDLEKVDNTHAVVYNAAGSHGMWKDAGNHVYKNIVVAQLTDVCSQGTAWDTWNHLRTFEYDARNQNGRGLGAEEWPSYFDRDYSNPNSMSVRKWGNPSQGSFAGQPLRSTGPGGPEEKEALSSYTKLN